MPMCDNIVPYDTIWGVFMTIMEKSIQLLCTNSLFAECDRAILSKLCDSGDCTLKEFTAGEDILSPKSMQNAIGMILSGKATVTTPDPSKNVLLRYLNIGDIFGIANLFTEEPYVSMIRASTACKVFYLSESAVRFLLEHDTAFLYRYLEFLSGRICFLNRKIGYLTAGSAERRLALYLTSLEKNPITLPLSISALSELLDVGRASLYRAFDRLTADGFLKKEGRVFYLTNADQMLLAYQ